ncbi:MAG: TetR/AcrR family transcriptional regulator [Gemmatimonadaceae bacterium]
MNATRRARRQYDMARRSADAATTREEIIAAAHRLLDDPKGSALALDEVARAAGVTRATLYNHFGSRSALLTAVFEDQGRLIAYDRVRAAQQEDDPRVALTSTLRELGRAWSSKRSALRRTLALAVMDQEIEQLVLRYERYRRADIGMFAHRLAAAGLFGRGITTEDAAVLLGALTSFQFFDVLCLVDSPRDATRRLTHIVRTSLAINPNE